MSTSQSLHSSLSRMLLAAALVMRSSLADYLVLDVTPGDSTCAPENAEASVMIQTGHCMPLPSGIPLLKSYQLTSCSSTADSLSLSLSVYTNTDCTGSGGQEFSFSDLAMGCTNGTQLTCQTSDPYAVTENWPAFGLYVNDNTCTHPTLMAAFKPNCNTYNILNQAFSTDLTCSDEAGASFSMYGTDPALPYDGCTGTPSEQRSLVADVCTSFSDFEPVPLPGGDDFMDGKLKQLFEMVGLSTSDLYYYADCAGADNIPGIETASNSESSSEDDDSVSAEMMTVYIVAAVVGAALVAVGAMFYARRQQSEGMASNEETLLDNNVA